MQLILKTGGSSSTIDVEDDLSIAELYDAVENVSFIPAGACRDTTLLFSFMVCDSTCPFERLILFYTRLYVIFIMLTSLCSLTECQRLVTGTTQLMEGSVVSNGLKHGDTVSLLLRINGAGKGDSRYKKSTSCFRWKWKRKRTRRLQRKRRKMRQRAR